MKIGLVDLDTSHPANWIPVIRRMGHEVEAVWDGGTVFRSGYADRFAAEHGVPHVAGSLEEIADMVDCAIIHSCDWDIHLSRAEIFQERGIPVLIDKPIAGRVGDLKRIGNWLEDGYRICGGSSLRFNYDVEEFLETPVSERGEPCIVFAGCGIDEFSYGIHAYSLLCGILGPGAKSVRYLGEKGQALIEIKWRDGRMGIVSVGKNEWIPFYATVVTDKGVKQIIVDSARLYESLLSPCLPYLSGETDEPPVPTASLMEPELAAIAAMESRRRDGAWVSLDELNEASFAYDGAVFADQYRKQRGDY